MVESRGGAELEGNERGGGGVVGRGSAQGGEGGRRGSVAESKEAKSVRSGTTDAGAGGLGTRSSMNTRQYDTSPGAGGGVPKVEARSRTDAERGVTPTISSKRRDSDRQSRSGGSGGTSSGSMEGESGTRETGDKSGGGGERTTTTATPATAKAHLTWGGGEEEERQQMRSRDLARHRGRHRRGRWLNPANWFTDVCLFGSIRVLDSMHDGTHTNTIRVELGVIDCLRPPQACPLSQGRDWMGEQCVWS